MRKFWVKVLASYWSNEKGLVTVEWVGITAVVVVAAIVISAAIMESSAEFAGAVVNQLDASADSITP